MGYIIAILIILAVAGFVKGMWKTLFRPIFDWAGDEIQQKFINMGMNKKAARAMLSVVVIIAIVIIGIILL